MRLMLGDVRPSLLVDVDGKFDREHFEFFVVNGCWPGVFNKGHITTKGAPSGDFTSTNITSILCDDQDRLRGNYEDVFDNFDNPNYKAPALKTAEEIFPDLDDDIPF